MKLTNFIDRKKTTHFNSSDGDLPQFPSVVRCWKMWFISILLPLILTTIVVSSSVVADEVREILKGTFVPFPGPATYEEALNNCSIFRLDGQRSTHYLGVPTNPHDDAMVYLAMVALPMRRAWVGVRGGPDPNNRNWTTALGKPVGMTFWGPGEPNNYMNHDERCVEMRVLDKNELDRNWNDAPCNHRNGYICSPFNH